MREKDSDTPRRLLFRFHCAVCDHQWQLEWVGTLFGKHEGLQQGEVAACPQCGACKGHSDPARNRQPVMVGFEESSDFVVYESF